MWTSQRTETERPNLQGRGRRVRSDIGSPARGGVSATDDARITVTEVGRPGEVVRQVARQPKCGLGGRMTADDQRTQQVDALDSSTGSWTGVSTRAALRASIGTSQGETVDANDLPKLGPRGTYSQVLARRTTRR